MKWIKRPTGQRGFSLLELLIAMVVLAIGILATMAMQFSALAGFTSARETTGASEMARTVEQMIRTEARHWEIQGGAAAAPSGYTDGPEFVAAMLTSPGSWVLPQNVNGPVTSRFNEENSADDGPRRFCIYVAGEEMPEDEDYMRVAIAVVYPGSNSTFPGGGAGTCDDGNIMTNLNNGDRIGLETMGLRVSYLTTSIRAIDS